MRERFFGRETLYTLACGVVLLILARVLMLLLTRMDVGGAPEGTVLWQYRQLFLDSDVHALLLVLVVLTAASAFMPFVRRAPALVRGSESLCYFGALMLYTLAASKITYANLSALRIVKEVERVPMPDRNQIFGGVLYGPHLLIVTCAVITLMAAVIIALAFTIVDARYTGDRLYRQMLKRKRAITVPSRA